MRIVAIFLLLLFASSTSATTHFVGKEKTYLNPNELYVAEVVQNGDTILIEGEIFLGKEALAFWQHDDLLIKGVNGQPHLIADNQSILGKGIWVLGGDNIIVENIAFSGATVSDKNGAGIRLDGSGITVRFCYFHDNENGILTNNTYEGIVLIEHSEFEGGGFGDGYSHNIYIGHCERLIFQFNYVHHAKIGHQLKSRADENIIRYNRLMDETSGTSSRIIDLPNGGFSLILGNILMQGAESPNANVLGYGLEGITNPSSQLFVINNTFVSDRNYALFIDVHPEVEYTDITNNIFAGQGQMMHDDVSFDLLEGNVYYWNMDDFDFENPDVFNYRIGQLSIANDVGIDKEDFNGYELVPSFQYVHQLDKEPRFTSGSSIDAGAYELRVPLKVTKSMNDDIALYPNPGSSYLHINIGLWQFEEVVVCNSMGQVVLRSEFTEVETHQLSQGAYTIHVTMKGNQIISKSWIKL